MKKTEKIIIDNPEYTVTKYRRKKTGKKAYFFNSLPRYKRSVHKYYILYDKRRTTYYGDLSKQGVIKLYLENTK